MRRLALIVALVAFTGLLGLMPRGLAADSDVQHLDHVFVIIEENESYSTLLTTAVADDPNIVAYAAKFGLATNYYGIAHPSEENYVAMNGGNYFGITDDDDYTCPAGPASPNTTGCHPSQGTDYPNHTIYGANLAQQLDDAGRSWKGYFQTLPSVGYTGDCFPSATASPSDCLYAAKHNPFINFDTVQDHDLNKMVPIEQLTDDLNSGNVPNLDVIVPDQCHDMHGQGACATILGTNPCDNACLISAGDKYLKGLVDAIRGSDTWKRGHNAIVITWDEADPPVLNTAELDEGCCDAGSLTLGGGAGGGGHIPTIVITNADARHPDHDGDAIQDPTAFNHYSLLLTLEDGFGVSCVQNACDGKNIKPMTRLFNNP
jgi:hypothetical protein